MEFVVSAVEKKDPGGSATKLSTDNGEKGAKGTRRGRPLLPVTRKLAELAAQAVQAALKEEARNASDHERVRCICQIAFNGVFSAALKNSKQLSAEDKEFLKDLNYL